ncbi:UNVERIFIED_CONTAM: GNAT superfamily N-acetyltransferase [Brevibacillus sp. OAP136]
MPIPETDNIQFTRAEPDDAATLTEVAIRSFADEVAQYGRGPDGHDQIEQHLSFMQQALYYKICSADQIIGGFCLIELAADHLELGIIFLDPDVQNKRVGSRAMRFMEQMYPQVKTWTLDTGFESFRNQRFYEKCGYVQVGRTDADPETGFYKVLYQKMIAE